MSCALRKLCGTHDFAHTRDFAHTHTHTETHTRTHTQTHHIRTFTQTSLLWNMTAVLLLLSPSCRRQSSEQPPWQVSVDMRREIVVRGVRGDGLNIIGKCGLPWLLIYAAKFPPPLYYRQGVMPGRGPGSGGGGVEERGRARPRFEWDCGFLFGVFIVVFPNPVPHHPSTPSLFHTLFPPPNWQQCIALHSVAIVWTQRGTPRGELTAWCWLTSW